MFDSIFLAIETWMRGMLTSMVDTNLAAMFTEVNAKTADIASHRLDVRRKGGTAASSA